MVETLLLEVATDFAQYQVVDTIYSGRKARVLYSGERQTAQSGIALDSEHDLLFDYNQRLLELVRGVEPKRVLLIGGGAFTLPTALLSEYPKLQLDIVELDPKLHDIAEAFFSFEPGKNTRVHYGDGRSFLDANRQQYDLIIVDAFVHAGVPLSLQTVEATAAYREHLSAAGVLAMNVIAAYYGERSATLRREIAALQASFQNVQLYPAGQGESLWLPQNFIVVAHNADTDHAQYLRYAPTLPFQADPNEAQHDNS